jgi:glycosyltransferase involved in cell wall biosynthesis
MSERKMKVLFAGDCNNPHTRKWCEALANRGHEVHLFSLTRFDSNQSAWMSSENFWSLNLSPSYPVKRRSGIAKLSYMRAVPCLRQIQERIQPDLVNAHYASSYGLVSALAGVRPLLISVWGIDIYGWPERSRLHAFVMRRILNSACAVLSTSKVMGAVTARYTNKDIHVTPFGVDTSLFSPDSTKTTGNSHKFILGTVKALEHKYGIEYLFRAFSQLCEAGIDQELELHIYGDGSLRGELEVLMVRLGIDGRTTLFGRVPNSLVPEAFRSMDLAVFPSVEDSESFGVAALEAQACGVPVIASNVGGLPETVVDGETGVIVEPGNPVALAETIRELIGDRPRRMRMAQLAREHVVRNYDLEACVDVMEEQYRKYMRCK